MAHSRWIEDGWYKVCSKCREDKPVRWFSKNVAQKDGLQNECKGCKSGTNAGTVAKYGSYSPAWHRRKRYGVSPEQFAERLEACGGLCEVCRQPPHPSFGVLDCDHDHITGKFRGLLCRNCNNAIRCEDPAILRALADYLEQHAPKRA
jgi:hypothetical protein